MKSFIYGFTGAGKSTLLLKLQKKKEFDLYIDLDSYIEKYYLKGQAVAEYIDESGFKKFRNLEVKALKKLSREKSILIALGGGSLREDTFDILLTAGFSAYWLNEDFETCFKRIQNDNSRPISKLSKKDLHNLYERRKMVFNKCFESFNEAHL